VLHYFCDGSIRQAPRLKADKFQPIGLPRDGIGFENGEKKTERITTDSLLTEIALLRPIEHGRVLTGWVAFSIPADLARKLRDNPRLMRGAIRSKDYLAHTYSVPFTIGDIANSKNYVPGVE
jgi:hypothetical protein